MAKIIWDAIGERFYETGVNNCVLYVKGTNGVYGKGVAWNGITGITESPSGAEPNDLWADNIKYAVLRSAETLGGTIEAYTYPDEFGVCDGTEEPSEGVFLGQQKRRGFGLSYKTLSGDDAGTEYYKLHLIYNAEANPSERAYATVNDSPEAITFSWEFTTTAVPVTGYKPVSSITIDSRKCDAGKLKSLEDTLYGTDAVDSGTGKEPKFPTPDEVLALLK